MTKRPTQTVGAPDAAKDGLPPGADKESGSGRPNPTLAMTSAIQGREEEFGRAVNVVLKTMADTMPYKHYFNDALVKAHLSHIQFAKDHGLLDEMISKDQQTMSPMLGRIRGKVEETGDTELGMIAMFDRTSCFYQMLDEWDSEPGMRRYKEPFGYVLEFGKRIGQFDMTVEEIHDIYTKPRYHGYAAQLGLKLDVSNIDPEGYITVRLI
ncbi:MAG: hypothetical protein RJS98_13795 [Rhodospirillaceae bacterium]